VHEVNPRWTAHRRRGLRRLGKSDVLDAQAVARLWREEGEALPLVQAETVTSANLQLWSPLRDDVVLDMTLSSEQAPCASVAVRSGIQTRYSFSAKPNWHSGRAYVYRTGARPT
jgi:hypothetical protein